MCRWRQLGLRSLPALGTPTLTLIVLALRLTAKLDAAIEAMHDPETSPPSPRALNAGVTTGVPVSALRGKEMRIYAGWWWRGS
jgi:hypothetical protein